VAMGLLAQLTAVNVNTRAVTGPNEVLIRWIIAQSRPPWTATP